MAYTKLQIYQMASDALDDEVITDVSQDSKMVRWLNRNYQLTKESLLSMHRWKFARKRADLSVTPGDTGSRWDYKYQTPSDALLIYRPTVNGEIGSQAIPFEYEGGLILTSQTPPLRIRYIANVNEDKFVPLFVTVLVASLALKAAHFVTHKSNMVQIAKDDRRDALRAAMLMDAIENFAEPPVPYDIELVRFENSWGNP
jgi:hypothetical protein